MSLCSTVLHASSCGHVRAMLGRTALRSSCDMSATIRWCASLALHVLRKCTMVYLRLPSTHDYPQFVDTSIRMTWRKSSSESGKGSFWSPKKGGHFGPPNLPDFGPDSPDMWPGRPADSPDTWPEQPGHVARTARTRGPDRTRCPTARTCDPDSPDTWPGRPEHVARTARHGQPGRPGPDGPDTWPEQPRTCGPDFPDTWPGHGSDFAL